VLPPLFPLLPLPAAAAAVSVVIVAATIIFAAAVVVVAAAVVLVCACSHYLVVDMLAVSIMMKTIKIKTLLEVLLRDASG
jgi:hypothetical protein